MGDGGRQTPNSGQRSAVGGRLTGRVAIVTGGGRGIGQIIARAFAHEGAAVVVAARSSSEVEETAHILHTKGQPVLAVRTDISDRQAIENLVTQTIQAFGGVHILVNNAGMLGPIGPLVENDISLWVHTIEVNLIGIFLCCKAVLPHMQQQQWGKIINLSGGGATAPRPYFSAYAASKAAVVRLTETLAEEVREYNIQVNAIAPGAVNTRMLDQVLAAGTAAGATTSAEVQRQRESGGVPPEKAAALAVFLASDESDGLTGKLIAAPHDGWEVWDGSRISEVMSAPWFTLRRIDPYTLRPLVDQVK